MNFVLRSRSWRATTCAAVFAGTAVATQAHADPTGGSVGFAHPHDAVVATDSTARVGPAGALARLPLRFEPNVGQAAPHAEFVARGPGYGVALHSGGAVLALRRRDQSGSRVALELVGARRARGAASGELAGRSHYLVGDDPAAWRRDVPGFGRVVYRDVYPGVDLVWHGRQRQLEYDFVLAPGVDPGVIRLRFLGAESIELRGEDLVLHLEDGGEVVQPRPLLFQEGPTGTREVSGSYVLDGDQVGFSVDHHDPTLPLVIDPVLAYSTYLGGGAEDFAEEVAVDATGNAYVTGETAGGFPLQGPFDSTLNGTTDAFVTKLSPSGALVYSTYLGGSNTDHGRSIAVDGAGNAYVVGTTRSTNFPLVNAQQPTKGDPATGFTDGFVTKLNAAGTSLAFSTYLGGGSDDVPFGVALGGASRVLVAGYTRSTNFPVASAFQGTFGGGNDDAFVTAYDLNGSRVYSTFLGGTADDRARDVAGDASGNAYVVGHTQSSNFGTTPGAHQTTPGGSRDGFVTKLSSAGARLWSTFHGGTGMEEAIGVDVDAAGAAYVTGFTQSTPATFPLANALDATRGGTQDAFLSKFASSGATLTYSTYLGGDALDEGRAVAVDPCGRAFVAGETNSNTGFPLVLPIQNTFGSGTRDAFLIVVTAPGAAIAFSTYLGGTAFETAGGVDVDACVKNAFLVGETQSSNFPRANAADNAFAGVSEGFVTKINVGTDAEPDGIPDLVEPDEGRNPLVKDNELFTNARWFAMQQYRDFLGREGDAGGITFWTNAINSGGASRAQTVENFFNSAEFQTTTAPVIRLYFAYFLRIPDFAGLQFWLNAFRSGVPLAAISQAFATSDEFQDTYGSLNNRDFVELVYNNVLGRAPDPGGWDFWTEKLDTNQLNRGEVMLAFSESDEYRELSFNEVYVVQMYVGMLRRSPEQSGFDFWLNHLDSGNSGLDLIQGFLNSGEYHDRFLP